MAARMKRLRAKETDRIGRSLLLHRLATWSSGAMQACLFLLFLCVGDLLGEFIDPSAGVTKLAALLVVLVAGCGYIAFRTFHSR
jgi:hypothetical protein